MSAYIVKPGDTPGALAKRFATSAAAAGITDPRKLRVGTKIDFTIFGAGAPRGTAPTYAGGVPPYVPGRTVTWPDEPGVIIPPTTQPSAPPQLPGWAGVFGSVAQAVVMREQTRQAGQTQRQQIEAGMEPTVFDPATGAPLPGPGVGASWNITPTWLLGGALVLFLVMSMKNEPAHAR